MHPLSWYLDTAKQRQGIQSDNQLAQRLGISQSSVVLYRKGRAVPGEKRMLDLTGLCVSSPAVALLDRSLWIYRNDDEQAAFRNMRAVVVAAETEAGAFLKDIPVDEEEIEGPGTNSTEDAGGFNAHS